MSADEYSDEYSKVSVGSIAAGYPCPKDGSTLTLIESGAWCPTCHTTWREVDEVDLADLDALPETPAAGPGEPT